MDPSASARAGWFQVSLKTLVALVLVVAAFFAGEAISQRRTEKAVRDAQEAADVARQQEEQVRRELEFERRPRYPPCHPGCFPAGTLVRVPQGTMPIERISEGDSIITVGTDGKPASGKVVSVFVTRNRLVNVRTDSGSLETTQ